MYVVERWLARLALSPYASDFVLNASMLLAGLGARRPTADADAPARHMAADEATVTARVVEIALIPLPEDGVRFDVSTVQVQQIRQESLYAFRGSLVALSAVVGSIAEERSATYRAFHGRLALTAELATRSDVSCLPGDWTGKFDGGDGSAGHGRSPRWPASA